jgi:hypothetical protein
MKTFFFFTYRAMLAFLLITCFILAFAPALLLAFVAIWVSCRPRQRTNAAVEPVRELNQAPALVVAR